MDTLTKPALHHAAAGFLTDIGMGWGVGGRFGEDGALKGHISIGGKMYELSGDARCDGTSIVVAVQNDLNLVLCGNPVELKDAVGVDLSATTPFASAGVTFALTPSTTVGLSYELKTNGERQAMATLMIKF